MLKGNKFKVLVASSLLFFLFGCSVTEGIDEQVSEVQLQQKKLHQLRDEKPKYTRVRLQSKFYVPPIDGHAVKLPSWYSAPVTQNNINVPFNLAVDEAIKNHPITVDYSDLTETEFTAPISIEVNKIPLGEVLERISNQAGVALTYSKGRPVFSRFERRTFPVVALPGKHNLIIGRDGTQTTTTSNNNLSSVSTSMTATTSGQYSSIRISDGDPIKDLADSISTVLSKEGKAQYASLGALVTVQDYPFNVEEVAKIVKSFNREHSKQVEVKISLIDVIFTDDHRAAVDYNMLLSGLGDDVEFGTGGGFTTGGAGTLSPMQFSFKILDGMLDGSEILAEALNKQGSVSRTIFQKVVTANGTIGRSKAVTRESYIAEQYGNGATTGGIITSGGTRQEMLETGQVLTVYPRIFEDDVFLKFNNSISANLGITPKTNEDTGTYVESPKVADMEFDQTVIVPHSHTLVIGGLDVDSALTSLSNAGYDVLGFSKSGSSESKETLLTISVNIIRGKTKGGA